MLIDLLAGLDKGTFHAPDGFGPDAPQGWVSLDHDPRALKDGGTGWIRKAYFSTSSCALGEKADFTKDVQAVPTLESRWVCKAYYIASTPGYKKPALFLYADRNGTSQSATRQLPEATAAQKWVVSGDLRMGRLPRSHHGFHMWVKVKSGFRNLCSLDLTDHSHQKDGGGSNLVLKAGETSVTMLEDLGVYTEAEQIAKTDVFGQAFTLFNMTASMGKITLKFGDFTADVPAPEWQYITALEFGCRSEIEPVEFGIGNLKFIIE